LFHRLTGLDNIQVDDFQVLCKECSVLPGGAIETINTVAFDIANEGFIEEQDDYLVLNQDVAKEMLA
jgi:hypothetical protein